jgi:hypothetical protein
MPVTGQVIVGAAATCNYCLYIYLLYLYDVNLPSLLSLVSAGVSIPAEARNIWQLCRQMKKFFILAS